MREIRDSLIARAVSADDERVAKVSGRLSFVGKTIQLPPTW
jgi:hypothetical protein